MVFNARSQFDVLRRKNLYGRFASVVREREIALQGCSTQISTPIRTDRKRVNTRAERSVTIGSAHFDHEAPPAANWVRVDLRAGEALEVLSPRDEQVADLALYAYADPREYFSAGRTLDYNACVFLTTGSTLYSNRSTPMMRIELDHAGRHDYLLAPCSARMYQILRNLDKHPSCHENLAKALQPFNISADDIHATFNAFMRVDIDLDGRTTVMPPLSEQATGSYYAPSST